MEEVFINNRIVKIADLLRDPGGCARSSFEKKTFDFIADWLNGRRSFQLRSSGSTGKPKEITLQRQQMEWSANATGEFFQLQPGENALLCLDTAYIAGMMMVVRCLTSDLKLMAVEPTADPIGQLPRNSSIHFTAMVPMQLAEVLKSRAPDDEQLNSIRHLILGGGPVDNHLMQKILGLAFPVYQSFGMTETCSHIALRALNGPEKSDQYKVLPGLKISQDHRGCLEIWGPVVTHEPFVTNDIVELIDDEHFIWKGRADNLINSGGIKLSPEEIEVLIQPILGNFGLQRPYFVFGIPDEKLGEKACLLYEDSDLEKDLYTPLLNDMKKHLPPFLAPKAIFTIQNVIYTDTGKVRRKETLNEFFKKKES